MIIGVGVDAVNIVRFKYYSNVIPNLLSRLFSPRELRLNQLQLAGNFAASEAFFKACPADYLDSVSTIEFLRDNDGKPTIEICDFNGMPVSTLSIHISLTNLETLVIAMIVVES